MTSAWTKTFPCNVITWLVLDSFHLEFQVGSGVRLMGPTGAVVVASSGGLLAFDVPSELITGSCLITPNRTERGDLRREVNELSRQGWLGTR
jgi:hypothetical protein